MNNKGWSLNEMLVLCLVLIIALFIAAIFINNVVDDLNNPNNQNKDYTAAYIAKEALMVSAAKEYWNDNEPNLNDGTLTITVKTLIAKDYLTVIKDPQDSSLTCTGYVIISNNYAPYLICGANYMTSGYTSLLDK